VTKAVAVLVFLANLADKLFHSGVKFPACCSVARVPEGKNFTNVSLILLAKAGGIDAARFADEIDGPPVECDITCHGIPRQFEVGESDSGWDDDWYWFLHEVPSLTQKTSDLSLSGS
jgi:hypothetical protein